MNIQDYISSGVLEQYVLGQLSEKEEAEVLTNAAKHPEIRAELDQIELDLERYARLHALPPPAGILKNILDRIKSPPPATPPPSAGSTPPGGGNANWLPWLGIGLFAILALWQFLGKNQLSRDNAELRQELRELREDCAEQDSVRFILAQQLDIYRDPDYRTVYLNGTELAPSALASVLYNPTDQSSYFTPADLPPPPSGKQYQLWALVDGQPVDMGVLALNLTVGALTEVPYVPNAGAFAITLEDEGGKPTPDLSQLTLIGQLS